MEKYSSFCLPIDLKHRLFQTVSCHKKMYYYPRDDCSIKLLNIIVPANKTGACLQDT